jgi:esterase/lipase superfamily enzyme
MHIEEHHWHSPHLEREMSIKVYGHWGRPLIVFPCSRGRYFDYEGMGMIDAISGFINTGRIKLFCVDSIDAESWYDFSVTPAERNARHETYDRYITDEVVPFIRAHYQTAQANILTNGCSMGAYHAANFFFKHPNLFGGTLALSGLYRLDRIEFGLEKHELESVYFNSPLTYLPGIEDDATLYSYRHSQIVICCGQGAWDEEALSDTRDLEHILQAKQVPAWIDVWGYDVNHDWPWWFKQMNYFLDKLT